MALWTKASRRRASLFRVTAGARASRMSHTLQRARFIGGLYSYRIVDESPLRSSKTCQQQHAQHRTLRCQQGTTPDTADWHRADCGTTTPPWPCPMASFDASPMRPMAMPAPAPRAPDAEVPALLVQVRASRAVFAHIAAGRCRRRESPWRLRARGRKKSTSPYSEHGVGPGEDLEDLNVLRSRRVDHLAATHGRERGPRRARGGPSAGERGGLGGCRYGGAASRRAARDARITSAGRAIGVFLSNETSFR